MGIIVRIHLNITSKIWKLSYHYRIMMFPFLTSSFKQLSRAAEAAEVLDGEYIQHQCKDLQTMDGSMVLLVCRKLHNLFLVKNRSSGRKFHTLLSRVNPQRYVGNDMVLFSRCKLHMSWPYLPPSIFWQMLNLCCYQQQNVIARWVDACKWHDLYESWVFIDLPTIKEFLPLDPRHRDEVARGDSRVPERVEISAPKFGDLYKPL